MLKIKSETSVRNLRLHCVCLGEGSAGKDLRRTRVAPPHRELLVATRPPRRHKGGLMEDSSWQPPVAKGVLDSTDNQPPRAAWRKWHREGLTLHTSCGQQGRTYLHGPPRRLIHPSTCDQFRLWTTACRDGLNLIKND